MSQRKILILQLAAVAVFASAFVACSGSSYEEAEATAAKEMPGHAAPGGVVSETVVAAKLAGADLVDGEEDFVVGRCPGCALAMEGSADHAMEFEGYQLHFCSDSCRDSFAEDTMAKVAELDVEVPGT